MEEKYEIIKPAGIEARKNEGLPFFVLTDILIFKDDFMRWLIQQKDDKIRLQVKQDKDGAVFITVNHWFKSKSTPKKEIIERIINKEN